jgi:DNA-binding CsgD family transcriptional regulator
VNDPATCTDPADEGDRLDLLADARWWLGAIDACIEAREAAYHVFDDLGATRRAGQAAVWLYEHHCFLNRPAIGSGWLGRARRALDGDTECVAWGNLLLREAELAHGGGDLAAGTENATTALELGRALRSADLEAEALQTLGRLLIDAGEPGAGLAHLDEAMLFAIEGRLRPYAAGKVYCSLVGACEDLGDLRRAAEWTDATTRWAQRHPFAVFPGLCRMKRAESLMWSGDWVDAEREARRACEELATIKVGSAAAAWAEVGEIRRRIGDLDGAEEAFARAEELCCTPASGLALLRLAQGRIDVARRTIDGALQEQTWNRLARARLLPAKVPIAADFATDVLIATALVSAARVDIAAGDPGIAQPKLRRAIESWQDLDVPYETATAQLLLGHAHDATGDADAAQRLVAAASAVFDRLGAAYDARPLVWSQQPIALPCGLTEREAEVLRLVAQGLTNKKIAAHLSLSEKTIGRHLSNIFVKTGVATRAAATAFAFESDIVRTRT